MLLRFDNFEEGAKLTYKWPVVFLISRLLWLRTFAFLLVLNITKIIVKLAVMSLIRNDPFDGPAKNFSWPGNSLDFFFYLKRRVHVILREITMRKLSRGKDLQSRASQLGSDTCKCESYRNVLVLNLLACHFLVNIIIIIIYELIVRSLTWEWSAVHYNFITLQETNKR